MNANPVTLIASAFQTSDRARAAVEELGRAGFRDDQIAVISRKEQGLAGEILAVLIGLGLSHPEATYYQEASACGQTLVIVEAEGRYRAAQRILERNGSINSYSAAKHPQDAGPLLVGWPYSSVPSDN
jgi:hypothetical protein